MRGLWLPNVGHRRDDLPGHADTVAGLVPRHVVGTQGGIRMMTALVHTVACPSGNR
jgi:hypothetical protein